MLYRWLSLVNHSITRETDTYTAIKEEPVAFFVDVLMC